jgi:hypothetical protein
MGLLCPNINHPDWKYAVEKLGKDEALYLYDLLNQEIPSKEQVDTALNGREKTPSIDEEKQTFIDRINSRIENGMYREKSGKLVAITPSYNAETFWIENKEGLVTMGKKGRTEKLWKFHEGLAEVVRLNQKYKGQFLFEKVQKVWPKITVAKSYNPSPDNKPIYRIKVTQLPKPLNMVDDMYHSAQEASNSIVETRQIVEDTFKSLEGKTTEEALNIINNLEISQDYKDLLVLFTSALIDYPNLKFNIDNTKSEKLGEYDPTTNIITLFPQTHYNQFKDRNLNLDQVVNTFMHEFLHAFTAKAFLNNTTEREKEFNTTITRLFNIAKKQTKFPKGEGYKDEIEWIARVTTDPRYIQEAKYMGFTLWQRFIYAIKKLFGLDTKNSVYDHALKIVFDYVNSTEDFETDLYNIQPKYQDEKVKMNRLLEEDIYLQRENLTHKKLWDTLNTFSKAFKFDPVAHTYTHIKSKQDFYSVTEMMSRIGITSSYLSSDPEKRANSLAARQRGADIGEVIHNLAEVNLKQVAIHIAESNNYGYDEKVISQIEHILRQFKRKGVTILSEVLVADLDVRLAGTIDMVIIDENNNVHIYDFKNKEHGFKNYLTVTKFGGSQAMSDKDRHAIQVSAYKDMFEKMTGLNVVDLNIITLKPTIENGVITNIELDKTHSPNGIIQVDYSKSVSQIFNRLKVSSGQTISDDFETDKVDAETRKKIDDDLSNKYKQAKEVNAELNEKEKIVQKSIDALFHKQSVLYRTGRRNEIPAQERLIEELLDEADVEKQLLLIIKYANTSAFRIMTEYNRYREEGRKIPLRVLYSWKDSMSAFDALTNEKEGLKNIIIREFGFKKGPEYKVLLDKTVEAVNTIKSLYEAEGLDQLIDFLTPFYNELYAKEKLLRQKEYRRLKFLGQIKGDITEQQYVENKLNENKETLEQQTKVLLRVEVKKASRDIGVLTRWLDNLLDSTDPVTAAMVKAFAFADEESRIGAIEKRDEVVSFVRRIETWYNQQGRIPKSNIEFYNFMLERRDGKLTGHYVTPYKSEMMREYRDIVAITRGLDFIDEKELQTVPEDQRLEYIRQRRKEFIGRWLEENMPLDKDEFNEAYWSYVEEQNSLGYINDSDFAKLDQNRTYKNKLTLREMAEKSIISFETEDILSSWLSNHTWDYRYPIDKWANPQYADLLKIINNPNDPRGEFYNYILQLRREADNNLPFGFRLDSRLPGIIKQNWERVASGQSIGSVIRGAISDELTFKVDDTSRVHEEILDESGNHKYFLPIHFTGRVTKDVTKLNEAGEEFIEKEFDEEEQSFDIAGMYHKYWVMANDYATKNDILPEMEMAKYMIETRKTIKRNSFGDAIFKKRSKGDVRPPETAEEVLINNSQLAQQLDDWFLACVYGIQEQDAGKIGNIDVSKLMNFINKYTSLNLLGLNVVAGTANVILGETLQRIESFAGEYMSPTDFMYADKFYLKTMKGMIGDIGSRNANGLGTHLVEYFGVFDDYGEADMDLRTKAAQLFATDTLYATSHLGEHYMQTRFLFGLLANKRALDKDGKDIGRMIDQYELKNNKLVLNSKVDVVKSHWEERDILEFKSKVRGLLSRLHGEYGALGKVAIQRYAIGRMAYLFRHFVVPGFRRRWGKERYIERLGQYVEGNYITTGKFMGAVGSKIFGKNEENKEEMFFARLMSNLQSFKLSMVGEEWAALSDHQKANVYRTLYEVSFLIASIVLANILAGIKPPPGDDEEATRKYWAFVMYQTYRLQNEILFFINPNSSMSILRSPMASMSVVENLIKLSGQIFDPTAVYESGAWKGRPKIIKTLNDMVPVEKQWYRLQDMMSQMPWMQRSGFGGKNNPDTEYTTPTQGQ